MTDPYVEQRDGGYYVRGSRVSLDSIVCAFRGGDAPETIVQCFPVLHLDQVYGAIAFYLSHRSEIDGYLEREEADFERRRQAQREANPEMARRFDQARQSLHTPK